MNEKQDPNLDWQEVKILLLDSDGVLTDGGVYYTNEGAEFRRFDIKDGAGIRNVIAHGIKVGIISGSHSKCVLHRASQLGITDVYIGVDDKVEKAKEISKKFDVDLSQIVYLGDDEGDIPILNVVGFPCAVNNAVKDVRKIAIFITSRRGGKGAVREICDKLLEDK